MMSEKVLWLLDNVNRIGHIFYEPYNVMNVLDVDRDNLIIFIPGFKKPANTAALDFIRKFFNVEVCHDRNLFVRLFNGDENIVGQLASQGVTVRKWSNDIILEYAEKYGKLENMPKFFSFDGDDVERGYRVQEKFGIPRDAKVVAFHNREAGYLSSHGYHSFRDADVNDFIPAIELLGREGYWVVRVGDATMKKLPKMRNVVDLPFCGLVDEFADLWFLGSCDFMIGNSSGPMVISYVFSRPRLLFNMIGSGNCYATKHDIYLPKRLRSTMLGRDLTLHETEGKEFNRSQQFLENGLEVINNSPQEILDGVKEMLDRINDEPYIDSKKRLLQRRYRSILEMMDTSRQENWPFRMKLLEATEISYSFLERNPSYLI